MWSQRALAHTDNGPRLYAADAATTNALVFNSKWRLDSILKDRRLPAGLTTYNVAVIGKKVYVSYAPPPYAAVQRTNLAAVRSVPRALS